MKELPIGIQTFSKLIKGNYLYVDKTKEIHQLFAKGGEYYFMSRPRRFGKSLLLSTLEEIFSGNKELFKGLWIYDKIKWEKFPVIHIDFSGLKYGSKDELMETLDYLLDENAKKYKLKLTGKGYDKRFKELITELSKKGKVVILIDEYDKPIIDFIEKKQVATDNRDILRNFYSTIKGADKYIKFAFITGVSKFSKVSVFSGLNNLNDITLDDNYSAMLGYTDAELTGYFEQETTNMANHMGVKKNFLLGHIRKWYNGYSWDGKNFVYNPFSILLLFSKKTFDNYWFTTGTPTFLTQLIRSKNIDVTAYENLKVGSFIFESFDIENIEVASLLFQTGYLTIKEKRMGRFPKMDYWLNYPNREVKEAFLRHLLKEYTERNFIEGTKVIDNLSSALEENNVPGFVETLQSLFASIPYNIFISDKESYYHTIIYLVLTLTGLTVNAEVQTNQGRIDAVLETQKNIYIMEFKLGTSLEALNQVKDKKYYQKYLSSRKEITVIGIGFNRETRNISDYKAEIAQLASDTTGNTQVK